MSSYSKSNRRGNYGNNYGRRRGRYTGSKTETIRKPVPRISTINNKVKKLEKDIELKYKDVLFDGTVSAAGQLILINGMNIGAGVGTRVGNEIDATSMQFRSTMTGNSTAIVGPIQVRCIVFWDRQANGTAPTLYGDPTTGSVDAVLNTGVITNPIFAPYQYESQERFRILYDKVFIINPVLTSNTDPTTGAIEDVFPFGINVKRKIKLSRRVKYDGTDNATIATIRSNSLYMAYVSDQATTQPAVYTGIRLYYKDA